MNKNNFFLSPVKMLLIFFTTSLLIWSCNLPSVKHSVAAEKLFIPENELPKGWVYTNQPKPMGPHTIGFGDEEDDRYVPFHLATDKEEIDVANEFILQFSNPDQAKEWYDNYFPTAFALTDAETTEKLTGPKGLNFRSKRVTQFFMGCRTLDATKNKQSCKFIAQYDSFVVMFSSAISPDATSIGEYNRLIGVIDRIFTNYLR